MVPSSADLPLTTLDPDARRELMARKLAEQKLARARRGYLDRLPEELRTYLEARETIFFHLSWPRDLGPVGEVFWWQGNGWHDEQPGRPHFQFSEYAWPEKVLAAAARATDERCDAEPAWFWPMRQLPVFRVEFGWVRRNLRALFFAEHEHEIIGRTRTFVAEQAGVATEDRRGALIIDNDCGCLPHDINPDETVYELAVWGFPPLAPE